MGFTDHADTSMMAAAASQSVDSPPSYSEAMKNPGTHDQPSSIWTTPIRPVSTGQLGSQVDTEVDTGVEAIGALGGMARLSPAGLPKRGSSGGLGLSPTHESASSLGGQGGGSRASFSDLNSSMNTSRKREFRNWNPPMLGNLPDDFLRIMSPDTASPLCANSDFERLSNLTTSPVNVMSLTDARPKIHKSRTKSEKMSKSFSMSTKDGNEKESKSKNSDKRSRSGDKVTRSFSMADESTRSKGARHKDRHISPSHRSVVSELLWLYSRLAFKSSL